MAVQLLFRGVLLPGFVQYNSKHSCALAVQLLLNAFRQRPCGASIE